MESTISLNVFPIPNLINNPSAPFVPPSHLVSLFHSAVFISVAFPQLRCLPVEYYPNPCFLLNRNSLASPSDVSRSAKSLMKYVEASGMRKVDSVMNNRIWK